jgi:hypothetical protein
MRTLTAELKGRDLITPQNRHRHASKEALSARPFWACIQRRCWVHGKCLFRSGQRLKPANFFY